MSITKENIQKWGQIAGWIVTVAAVAYLVYRLVIYPDYYTLFSLLRQHGHTAILCLAVATLLIPAQLGIEARRWQWVLRGWKEITWKDSWRQVLIGGVAGFVTPYRSGDLPARLAMCGLDIDREKLKIHGKEWLKDWHKWFPVLLWTGARYIIWGVQLWAVLTACGILLTPLQALSSIALYYFFISVMPSVPAADVALKGGWATVVFGTFTPYIPAIAISVTVIWLLNTVIPVLCGVALTGWHTWTHSTSRTPRK